MGINFGGAEIYKLLPCAFYPGRVCCSIEGAKAVQWVMFALNIQAARHVF
jgi:hypothetical protein